MGKPLRTPRYEADFDIPLVEDRALQADIDAFVEVERSRGSSFVREDGHYQRQDTLDILRDRGVITRPQYISGKRYACEWALCYSVGQFPSTWEYNRHDARWSDHDVVASRWLRLRHTQRDGLRDARLAALCDSICGRSERAADSDVPALRIALDRLTEYAPIFYAQAVEEPIEITSRAPKLLSLRDEGAQLAVFYKGNRDAPSRRAITGVLYRAQGGCCAICDERVVTSNSWGRGLGRTISVDHAYPLSLGYNDVVGNLLLVHEDCNGAKGSRLPTDFTTGVLERVNMLLGWPMPSGEPLDEPWRLLEAVDQASQLLETPEEIAEAVGNPFFDEGAAEAAPVTRALWWRPHNDQVKFEARLMAKAARREHRWKEYVIAARELCFERKLQSFQSAGEPVHVKPRHVHIEQEPERVPIEDMDWSELLPQKPGRSDDTMHQKWLATEGVHRNNRDMRHLGVQAKAANKVKAKANGKIRKRRPRRAGNS